jgi:hypothetical protein
MALFSGSQLQGAKDIQELLRRRLDLFAIRDELIFSHPIELIKSLVNAPTWEFDYLFRQLLTGRALRRGSAQ